MVGNLLKYTFTGWEVAEGAHSFYNDEHNIVWYIRCELNQLSSVIKTLGRYRIKDIQHGTMRGTTSTGSSSLLRQECV